MKTSFWMLKPRFTPEDYARMDVRILAVLDDWRITCTYKGAKVEIPATWGSEVYPYKYFEVYKQAGDDNYGDGRSENEIMCYLSAGWRGTDDEVVIVLNILGQDRIDDPNAKVYAEIYKFTSNDMKLYHRDKLVTDFTEKFLWFFKRKVGKVNVVLPC